MFYAFLDSPWFLAALIGIVVVGVESGIIVGRWERRRASGEAGADDPDSPSTRGGRAPEFKLGVVQNAVLGVIALLTGFTFSAASSTHQTRSSHVREQCDSIGEVWRRADLVDADTRRVVRAALIQYIEAEISLHAADRRRMLDDPASASSSQAQQTLWSAIVAKSDVEARPVLGLADSINRLIQRHFARVYALRARTPAPMIVIVLVGVGISALILGVSWGGAAAPSPSDPPRAIRSIAGYILFTAMMALTVMVIRDLDQPYAGLITIDEANLTEMRDWMRSSDPTSAAP